jgi:hypothetical protein
LDLVYPPKFSDEKPIKCWQLYFPNHRSRLKVWGKFRRVNKNGFSLEKAVFFLFQDYGPKLWFGHARMNCRPEAGKETFLSAVQNNIITDGTGGLGFPQ